MEYFKEWILSTASFIRTMVKHDVRISLIIESQIADDHRYLITLMINHLSLYINSFYEISVTKLDR